MRHGHELGQSWPTKYGVVGGVEVGDVEVDVFNTIVAYHAKLYWKGNLSKRFGCPARYHTPEGVEGCEISYPKPQLLKGSGEEEV